MEARRRSPGDPVTLLYYGHLHRQHLDFTLIEELAKLRPEWRIVLVGSVKTPHVFPPNVQLVEQQPHERLRDFIATADVLLLPYAINDYTRSVLPAKIYECLATGRPIVAAPLPELTADFAPHLHFADEAGGFAAAVEAALAGDTAGERAARVALAEANTWDRRYRQLQELLAQIPAAPMP